MTSFAPVQGHDGFIVSSEGRIYGPEGLVKTFASNGYEGVVLEGEQTYVHRVVGRSFLENPEDKPQVAHWDSDKKNNDVVNLRWATQSENEADKRRLGLDNAGERCGKSRLTRTEVEEIRRLRAMKIHVDVVAAQFGVSRWTVYDACNPNRTWK